MLLLACRHGNTFAAGEKAVWIGRNEDLPLTAQGEEQARTLAAALRAARFVPASIIAAPLQRTRRYASILAEMLGIAAPVAIDNRLAELDYGSWAGLTSAEIKERGGQAELEAWERRGSWPLRAGWGESEDAVISELRSFLEDLTRQHDPEAAVLFVTSNGRLRMLLKFVPLIFEQHCATGTLKVATGNAGVLSGDAGRWDVLGWNLEPVQVQRTLTSLPPASRKNS